MIPSADIINTIKTLIASNAIPVSFARETLHALSTGDIPRESSWLDVAEWFDMHGYTAASEYCSYM